MEQGFARFATNWMLDLIPDNDVSQLESAGRLPVDSAHLGSFAPKRPCPYRATGNLLHYSGLPLKVGHAPANLELSERAALSFRCLGAAIRRNPRSPQGFLDAQGAEVGAEVR